MILNRSILVLLLLGVMSSLNAAHVKWYSDYEKALIIAKKQKKPIMLLIRKKDCTDCQKMFEITFLNQNYIKKLNDNYIAVVATYEDENSYPIELFYSLDFPALFFVSSEDESFLTDPIFGFISPENFSIKISNL